jgi:NAD(P)-dependent dehydrogenase (short-subunit alcohol dehydrogenase family)
MSLNLVFGATGYLGNAIKKGLETEKYNALGVSSKDTQGKFLKLAVKSDLNNWKIEKECITGVIWAQGLNSNDSVESFDNDSFNEVINANISYIINTLNWMLDSNLISNGARLVIISSIWEKTSRANKLSYSVSKSALSGLVKSLAIDLAKKQISVNAVLPGVIDSPMTHKNLTQDQISRIVEGTPIGKLITAEMIANVCSFLISEKSSGITGQSILVDGGWTNSRFI